MDLKEMLMDLNEEGTQKATRAQMGISATAEKELPDNIKSAFLRVMRLSGENFELVTFLDAVASLMKDQMFRTAVIKKIKGDAEEKPAETEEE